ncbi:phosphoribosylanthranilate isomerase [candidate division KSB1 bacterium]
MISVKICGITNVQDAVSVAEAGVNALGFVFYPKSKRYIVPEKAREIIKELPPFVSTVGLFVNEKKENVVDILRKCPVDVLQFHGDETPEYCNQFNIRIIKAFRVKDDFSYDIFSGYSTCAFLLDGFAYGEYGGTGVSFDWDIAVMAKKFGRIVLAGGLHPENMEAALKKVRPYGIDLSSGVEVEPGIKDIDKVKEIVKICSFF